MGLLVILGLLWSVCWPLSADAATRLGLHTTQEEVAILQTRMASGPYKTSGDVSTNSPGDWTRILANADNFVANPSQDRWAGQPTETCWSPSGTPAKPASRDDGERLRDAGFVYLLTGTTSYRDAVLNELLAQAATVGTQWVVPRWCTSPAISDGHSWEIAMWLTKLLYGYDYIRSSISSGNRTTLDAWFLAAGTYWETISRENPAERFPNRASGDYTTYGPGWGPDNLNNTHCAYGPCITHFGGHTKYNFHEGWNNRNSQQLRLGFLVGVMLEQPSLIAAGKRWVQEWLRFAVFSDNTPAEFNRWTTTDPCLGWYYAGFQIGTIVTIANTLGRYNGDTSLFTDTTTLGHPNQTPNGGPKSLLGVITQFMQYVDGTITRYGTNVSGNNGNPAYQIRSSCTGQAGATFPTFGGIMDTFLAPANVFYQDSYVESVYRRTASGAPAYPANPSTGGYGVRGGEWGTYPGVLFMFGQMEGDVDPFDLGPAPDFTSNLRMHLKFDEGTGTTAQDSTVNNHDGTLGTGVTWGAFKMGTSAVAFDGVDANSVVTVSGLLSSPAAITLTAWVKPVAYPTTDASVISLGDRVMLHVRSARLEGAYWTGSTYVNLVATPTIGTDTWHHVAYTAAVGAQHLYLDGVLVASGNSSAPIVYSGGGANTLLGQHGNAGTARRFQGDMDDVRVYTRALAALDIAGLADLEDPPVLSVLITTPTIDPSYTTTTTPLGNLLGIAADDVGVTNITWTCPTCTPTTGSATCTPPCAVDSTFVKWSIPSIGLGSGGNLITVTAHDAGGTMNDTVSVNLASQASAPCTHFASQTGVGNGLSQGSPFQIASFWAVTPIAGQTLCLLDGTYTGGNSMIQPPAGVSGSSGLPITVRALNEGAVLLDGQNATIPVSLQATNSWYVIEGVNARNGTTAVFNMLGNNNIGRRLVGWDGTSGQANARIFNLRGLNSVIEDCAGWGNNARVILGGSDSTAATGGGYRRCFAEYNDHPTGTVVSGKTLITGRGQKYENIIGTINNTGD